MNALLAIGSGLFASDVLLAALFRQLARKEPAAHLRWWFGAWLVSAVGSAAGTGQIVTHGAEPLVLIAALSMLAFSLLLMRGAHELIGRPLAKAWWFAAPGSLVVAAVAEKLALPWPLPLLAPLVFVAGSALWTGGIVLRSTRSTPAAGALAATSLALYGLHFVDFPFVGGIDWFVPWGMTLTLLLRVAIGASFVVLHFERTRMALAASEERYKRIFEDAVEGIVRSSPEGIILDANPAFARMLGYDAPAELIGKDGRAFYAEPTERERVVRTAERDPALQREVALVRKDGSRVVVVPNVRAVLGPGGEVQSYQSMIRDVTRARQLERELVRAQRLESVGRLAGGVAHDFNNLLTVIEANAGIIAAKGGAAGASAEDILQASSRAAALIQQLLTFAGREARTPRAFALVPVVRGVLDMLTRTIDPAIVLELEATDEDLQALADPTQVEQLVMNLVLNARDAMPSGGRIALRVARAAADDAGAPSTDKPFLVLEVRDEGEGIPAEILPNIFEPFFTTKPSGKGTGLGLATVHGIATRGGGSIDVESRPGVGTVFRIYLPEARDAAEPAPRVAREGERTSDLWQDGRPTVLLVDDETGVRNVCRRVLEGVGCEVLEADSGARALAMLASRAAEVDVLLTDVLMPGLTGPELASQVRALRPDIALVFMSGYVDRLGDHPELRGASIFLAKPFGPSELLAAVREAVGAKRAVRATG